ncbi:MAG: beta-N-acetylhexosaminidase [Salinisphaeraceae bacterium]|nr:beta-N-acetylhexosaminidase [Salinisphaeraceae bacterium]
MNKPRLLGPVMLDVEGLTLTPEDRELLMHPLVGGLILFTRNYEGRGQLAALCTEIRDLRPDILLAVDYEGGRVQRFREGFTRIPAMRRLGVIYDDAPEKALNMAQTCGWMIATELREFDIDLSFAPVLDLDGGVSEIIGDRAFHSDSNSAVELAKAFMQGQYAAGMASTGKHFPGHGQVAPDSHKELPIDERTEAEIQRDIQPFRALIEAGLPSVMMAHIRFPAVDDLPASLSSRWVRHILREDIGFEGAVFTDDLSMGGAAVMGSYVERAHRALEAGCDMLPVCNDRSGVIQILDQLPQSVDSQSAGRLARLRANTHNQPKALQSSSEWQEARQTLDHFNQQA